GQSFAALRELATIAALEKDWSTSTSYLAQARALLPVLPGVTFRSWLLHDEGRIAADRGDLDTAERAFLSYLSVASDSASDVLRYDVRMRMADIYARRG